MHKDELHYRYERIKGLARVQQWMAKIVTIIGLGSMGQPISSQFARHGVGTRSPGRIRLIDGDIVTPRNLIGTEYRQSHLNKSKAVAASEIVEEVNQDVNISYLNKSITGKDIQDVVDMATRSDLLGLFADSFELMLKISDECYDICPMVMAFFGPNADYAEVAFSVPQATVKISEAIGKRNRKAISKPAALGCDTAYICNFVASVCLRLLHGDADDTLLAPCYSNASLFVVGLRNAWIFENQPTDILRTIVCVETKQ